MKNLKIYILIASVSVIVCFIYVQNNTTAVPENKLKIGLITPLSGPAGSTGEALVKDVKLKEFNNVEFLIQDDQCNPKNAVSAYNVLKGQGVKVYIVACSGSVLALAPIAKVDGNLILTSYAGSSAIRDTGTEVIRLIPDAVSIVGKMNEYILSHTDKKFALISENQDYAKSVTEGLIAGVFKQNPNLLVARETFESNATDMRSQITKIKAKNPDYLIFVPTSVATAKIALQQMQELGLKAHIVGEVNVCEYPFTPKDFGFTSTCFNALLGDDELKKFQNLFVAKHGATSTSPFYDAVTYDLAHILNEYAGKSGRNIATTDDLKRYFLEGVKGEILSEYKFDDVGEVIVGDYLKEVNR